MKWDRTFARRALVWGAWALILLAGLAGLARWHSVRSYDDAIRRFEQTVGSARHQDYNREPVPNHQNQALAFRAAVSDIDLDGEWSRTLEPAAWAPSMEAKARETLARHAPALDSLVAAAELPFCVWQPVAVEAEPVSWSAEFTATRLLRLAGLVGVADGDRDRVERSFRTLGSLAECLYAQPRLVGSMVGSGVERARLEVLHAVLASPDTEVDLLEILRVDLERSARAERVPWAIAAEGALALRQLGQSKVDSSPGMPSFLGMGSPTRIATAVASRWVELKVWSEQPVEELSRQLQQPSRPGSSVTGLVADLLVPNLRSAIVNLRTGRALNDLAVLALEGRLYGQSHGSYSGAFDQQVGIEVMTEADGSVVLIDKGLESLIRAHFAWSGESGTPEAESKLDLTVWRLPPPAPEGLAAD